MRLVFLGPPGVGKGTYASAISEKYGVPHISTGDIFREEIKKGSKLGKMVKSYVDAGKLVPDDIVIEVVKQRLLMDDCRKGFILDGFPRTLKQAEALDEITRIDLALNFVAPDEVIIERISGRRICLKCGEIYHVTYKPPKVPGVCDKCGGPVIQREDDKPEVVKERLAIYRERFTPIIDHYKRKGILVEVYAGEQAEKVIPRIIEVLKKHGFYPLND
ncbi:MAG: adenylate kinase [Thermofilum sp. ex4484_82]|nr:MAG: adenylate kinase [Thermofilum sp. ex4484_82]OYT38156.1 MAG: adenylate kinase [Archaeoglobales archaeon ex4484_92]